MPKANVFQDEDRFYRILTGKDVDIDSNDVEEVDQATLDRWTATCKAFWKVQDEIWDKIGSKRR